MGISAATVRVQLHRARNGLRATLADTPAEGVQPIPRSAAMR